MVPVTEFLFGLNWSPQTGDPRRPGRLVRRLRRGAAVRGTLLISGIAMLVAVPVGLFSAIYLAEYAHGRVRAVVKPMLEVLAGIPTVVYGFFAALTWRRSCAASARRSASTSRPRARWRRGS
jgi:phosphate transport system permease protein